MKHITSEADLWKIIRSQFLLMKPIHYSRIETHATAIGFPDVEYCYMGVSGQIELKYCNNFSDTIKIRPAQIMWFTERIRAGGKPILITAVGRMSSAGVGDVENMIMVHYGTDIKILSDVRADVAIARAKHIWYDGLDVNEFMREIGDPWYKNDTITLSGGYRG